MNNLSNGVVDVTAYYFADNARKCFPKRIERNGQCLALLESGMRCIVTRGQQIVQIFTMTDGRQQYRLRFEPEARVWTLLGVVTCPR